MTNFGGKANKSDILIGRYKTFGKHGCLAVYNNKANIICLFYNHNSYLVTVYAPMRPCNFN